MTDGNAANGGAHVNEDRQVIGKIDPSDATDETRSGLSRRGFVGGAATTAAAVALGASRVRSAGATPGPSGRRAARLQGDDSEIIIGTLGDATTINPFLATDSEADVRCKWLFDEFVGVTVDTFLPTPGLGLAKDWTLTDLTYTFTLQPDLKFSDGTPLTAEDVAFTIKGMLAQDTASPRQSKYASIAGAEEFIAGTATDVSGLKALDEVTLEITLAKPDAPFLFNLRFIHPVPKALLDGKSLKDDEFFQNPIGAGAYVFESWESGGDFIANANPNYFQAGKPAIQRVIHRTIPDAQSLVTALLSGEIHASNYPSPQAKEQLEGAGNLTVMVPPFTSPDGWQFNFENEWCAKKEVRRAIAMSLDMKQFAQDSLYGLGAEGVGPIAPDSWAFDKELQPIPFDPDGAKELIATAGLPADGVTIKFMVNQGNVLRGDFLTYTQQQVEPLGIKVEAEVIDYTVLVTRVTEKDFEVNGTVFTGVTAEPSELAEQFLSNGSGNFSNYSNPELDDLLNQVVQELDQEKAKEIYKQIQAILMDELPTFFAWYRPFLHTVDNMFTGYTDSAAFGLFHTLENWTITE